MATPPHSSKQDVDKMVKRVVGSLPKLVPSGDKKADHEAELIRNALVSAIELLLRNMDKALFLEGSLTAALKNSEVKSDDDSWARPPKYVGGLEKGWMAQWIVKYDEMASQDHPTRFSREFLDFLESRDSKMVANLFQLFTGTSAYTELPAECKDSKSLTALVFTRRAQDIGNFMKGFRDTKCTPGNNGEVDLMKAMPYKLIWEHPDDRSDSRTPTPSSSVNLFRNCQNPVLWSAESVLFLQHR